MKKLWILAPLGVFFAGGAFLVRTDIRPALAFLAAETGGSNR